MRKLPRFRECARCEQTGLIEARGLCRSCYQPLYREGTLEDWLREHEARRIGRLDDVAELLERGLNQLEIAKRLEVTPRTINRAVRTLREEGRIPWTPRALERAGLTAA
ncbi:winged helix-turn-helix transcriptional regulator [Nonomuraea dietziae]|uniref:winged helix-turn-helix transcriptional regulator n=1 Tax=Nonomuraea dietziae TaxID=65515 RepID=UPI003423BFF6